MASWPPVLRMAQGPTDPCCAQSAPALSPTSAAGLQSETSGVVDLPCSVWGCWWHTSCSRHPAAGRVLPRACSYGCAGREHWTHSGPVHVSLCWSADSNLVTVLVQGTRLSWLTNRTCCWFHMFSLSSFPALLHNGVQKSKVWSCSVLSHSTCSPASRASYSPSGCARVARAAARIITVRKNVPPRDCLLIPAGRVLVCVYSQQIPPTACSLAITKSCRAGRLCSLPYPISLNPSPLPCSQGQFKGFHVCHLTSFMSPSDSQLHCWEFGSPVPLQHMCRKVLPITGSGFSLFLGARGNRAQPWDIGGFFCASSSTPSS